MRHSKTLSITFETDDRRKNKGGEMYPWGGNADEDGKSTNIRLSSCTYDDTGKCNDTTISESKPGHITMDEVKEIVDSHLGGKGKKFVMKSLGKEWEAGLPDPPPEA